MATISQISSGQNPYKKREHIEDKVEPHPKVSALDQEVSSSESESEDASSPVHVGSGGTNVVHLSQEHRDYAISLIEEFHSTASKDYSWTGGDIGRSISLGAFLFSHRGHFTAKKISFLAVFRFMKEERSDLYEKTVDGFKQFGAVSWGAINILTSWFYTEQVARMQLLIFSSSSLHAKEWNHDYMIERLNAKDVKAVAQHVLKELNE